MAYVTATYLIETLSIATALDDKKRSESLFDARCYATPIMERKFNDADAQIKESEYYIREKIEIGILAERVSYPWVKYTIMVILTIYVYGAMSLKYVTGALSLQQGLSFIFTDNEGQWGVKYPWTYYVAITIFGALSIGFSFGDIENSKVLQIVTSIIRIIVIICMYGGTIYYWAADGTEKAQLIDWSS